MTNTIRYRSTGLVAVIAAVGILAAPAAQAGHHHHVGAGILGALLVTDIIAHAVEPAPTVVVQQGYTVPVEQQVVTTPVVQQQVVTTTPVVQQYVTTTPVVVAPPPVPVYYPPVRPAPIIFGPGPRFAPPPPPPPHHFHRPPPPPRHRW